MLREVLFQFQMEKIKYKQFVKSQITKKEEKLMLNMFDKYFLHVYSYTILNRCLIKNLQSIK